MDTITQRQLRNENAAVVRGVLEGRSFTVTRHGEPVARIIPVPDTHTGRGDADGMPLLRPAKQQYQSANHPRRAIESTGAAILTDLREERL